MVRQRCGVPFPTWFDNAVKYGTSAAVSLIPETGCVVVLVEDEGPGIPRSERENVFEPFYRIGDARDPGTGGFRLGLSVTRLIVWEHWETSSSAIARGEASASA